MSGVNSQGCQVFSFKHPAPPSCNTIFSGAPRAISRNAGASAFSTDRSLPVAPKSNTRSPSVALDQVSQLARAGGRIGFGILGNELHLAARDAATLVDDVDGGFGGLVVPQAPRREDTGELAMVADHDWSRRLGEQVLGDGGGGRV
jgi:hypothetical protein